MQCRLPPLLGMVLAGLLLRNVGALSKEGVPVELSAQVCWACISVMLLKAGLLLKLRAFRARKLAMLRLGVLPCLKTASAYSFLLGVLSKMPPLLAIMCGLLLAPACSLSMSTDLQSLQQMETAHPSMTPVMPEVLTAAGATSIALCTLLASLFGQLAFPHGPRALIWLHLPLSLALGCAAGAAAAAICSVRLFWRTPWQRTAAAVLVAQTLGFLGFRYDFFGAAVLAMLAMGCMLSSMWDSGHPKLLTLPELPRAKVADEVGERLEAVWDLTAQPLLFGVAGAAVSFPALPHMAAVKCLFAALIGLTVKVMVTFFCLIGAKLPFKERLLITIYSMPQASTVLAICFLPLYLAHQFVGTTSDSFADYKRWADAAATTAVLGALLATPLSTLAMQFLAPRLQEALRRSAPVSHPSGFDGALDREASGQLPPAAGKTGAARRRSDNPFADGAPFGADVALPAGSATPLLPQQRPATTKSTRAAGTAHSDQESQLLQGSTDADAALDSIYISAVAGPAEENAQYSSGQGEPLHALTDESEEAHLLDPWVTKTAAEAEVVETGGQEDARRGTGNPFAAFLGNPFGLGRTLSRHFGSFTAGGWPSSAAFSALKEAEVEMAQDQASANNPMYAPQFQDYVVDRTDASFHANPTYGPIPNLITSAAERALNEGTTGDGEAKSKLLGRQSELRFGALRRMSAALAAAMGGNAAGRSSTMPAEDAVGSLEKIDEPPHGAESTHAAARSHLLGGTLHTASAELRSNMAPGSLADNKRGSVNTGHSQEEISKSVGRKYALGVTRSAGDELTAVLAGGWGAANPKNDGEQGEGRTADIAIDIGECSTSEYGTDSMHDSSDLTFMVTDGFDLEELPRTVSQLHSRVSQLHSTASQLPAHWQWHAEKDQPSFMVAPSSPQSTPKISMALVEADHLTGSLAAVTTENNHDAQGRRGSLLPGSMGRSAASLMYASLSLEPGADKGRSSDYALFAQLSAATSTAEGNASRPAPFALGYEVSDMGTAVGVDEDAAVGDAEADSFTFTQHSPRVNATNNSSPIHFVAPVAALLRQTSSTGHVLGILGSPDQPSKQSSQARADLSVDIDTEEPMQLDGHARGELMSPVRDWLDRSEPAWQSHEGQHGDKAQDSVQEDVQDTAREGQPRGASKVRSSLHVRVTAATGTSAVMAKDEQHDAYPKQGEVSWEGALNSTEQASDGGKASTVIDNGLISTSPKHYQEDVGLMEHVSAYGEAQPVDLESFDSIPLTPTAGNSIDTALTAGLTVGANSAMGYVVADSGLGGMDNADIQAEAGMPLADNSRPEPLHAGEDLSGSADWPVNSQQVMSGTDSDMMDTASDTSGLITEIRKASRPYSASRLRESLPSLRVLKEAGSTGVGRITSIPKSLGRLMRNSGSAAEDTGSELEPVLADEAQQEFSAPGPALLLAGGVAKTGSHLGDAKTGSYRSLLQQISARSGSSGRGGSGAAGPAAERQSGEVSDLTLISSSAEEEDHRSKLAHHDEAHVPNSGLLMVSPNESWLRKAHSITSPRPTNQDDLPAAGVYSLASKISAEDPDANTVVSTHFSSAKRYSDVDAKSPALLHAQASIKAYRRTDSSRGTSSREGSAMFHSNVTGSVELEEDDLDDISDVHDSFLRGPLSHMDDREQQTDGRSKMNVTVKQTDSGVARMQTLPLEEFSLREGPKKKGH
ncbi:g7834 [Coccomyxa elongata]